jgi:cytochrome P450
MSARKMMYTLQTHYSTEMILLFFRISRVCTESCKIRGVTFKEGMVVRVMTSPMYMDENLFEHPDKFIPERYIF